MATYQILYWQDIPSLVESRGDGATEKLQLSQRFQELIDLVAMKKSMAGTDAYLEQWNKGPRQNRVGTPREVVKAVADELEADYERIRSEAIAKCQDEA